EDQKPANQSSEEGIMEKADGCAQAGTNNVPGEGIPKAEKGPESSFRPQFNERKPERRRLVRNLRGSALFAKIREAERRMEAGERELGFYLLDLKRRRVYRDAKCTSFSNYIRTKTGLKGEKANGLVRGAKALELPPRP